MRVILNTLLAVTTATILLSGCGKIIDIAPVVYRIQVVDSDGNNLLDPQSEDEDAIDASKITAQYWHQEYQCQIPTRYYLPQFEGLQLDYHVYLGYILTFGEFGGNSDFDAEELTLIWPDGSSDVITYDRKVRDKLDGGIKVKHQEWFLNGVSVSKEPGAVIRIVKQPLYEE